MGPQKPLPKRSFDWWRRHNRYAKQEAEGLSEPVNQEKVNQDSRWKSEPTIQPLCSRLPGFGWRLKAMIECDTASNTATAPIQVCSI